MSGFESTSRFQLDLIRYQLREGSRAVRLERQPMELLSNSHVQIVGTADSKAASAASDDKKKDGDDLPKFAAKRITRIAATCPA